MISVIASNNQIVINARIVNPERIAGHGVSNGIQKKSNVIKLFLRSIDFNYLRLFRVQIKWSSNIDRLKYIHLFNTNGKLITCNNTINKRITPRSPRSQLVQTTHRLTQYMIVYHNEDSTDEEKQVAISKMKIIINKSYHFSAFCRWMVKI